MSGQYVVAEDWIRLDCDLTDADGNRIYDVWIEARKNLTIGEQRRLQEALEALNDEMQDVIDERMELAEEIDLEFKALNTRPADLKADAAWTPDQRALRANKRRSRDLGREIQQRVSDVIRRRRELVFPHIRAWNLSALSDDGTVAPVPPPREGGVDALDSAAPELVDWMISRVSTAYQLGKALTSTTVSAGSQEPTNEPDSGGPKVIPMSNSRASRKSSSRRTR